MAIFHLSVKTFSRSNGQSATAAVAYRAGEKIKCEREGRTHDYTKKGGVLHSEIFVPDNAPSWASDRQTLWNKAEESEKRKNSTVAREFEVALPYELSKSERIELVQEFSKKIVERHGCVVDAHLHDDNSRSQKPNHHAHIMLTTREIEKDGFTAKTRELDQKQSGEVVYWREQWARTVNEHLHDCGIDKHIDHRSLEDQGLEREPTIKMGVVASALERKGLKTDKGNHNRSVAEDKSDEINKHLKTMFKQAKEFYNKTRFIERRLPEVKRDIREKEPNLYQALDDMGIKTAPVEEIEKEIIEFLAEENSPVISLDTPKNPTNEEVAPELPKTNIKTDNSTSDSNDRLYHEDVEAKNLLEAEQCLHPNTKIAIDSMRMVVDERWKDNAKKREEAHRKINAKIPKLADSKTVLPLPPIRQQEIQISKSDEKDMGR